MPMQSVNVAQVLIITFLNIYLHSALFVDADATAVFGTVIVTLESMYASL